MIFQIPPRRTIQYEASDHSTRTGGKEQLSSAPLRQFHAHARIGLFTVASTVSEILAAKTRNSAQCNANAEWLKYPASAKVRKTVKTHAKTLSCVRNPLLYPAELRRRISGDVRMTEVTLYFSASRRRAHFHRAATVGTLRLVTFGPVCSSISLGSHAVNCD